MTLPNFLYIGPDKAGSTWIYRTLSLHPEIYMAPAKELFFFNYHYNEGQGWYQSYFKQATSSHKVIGEVSHDYLFSPEACKHIKDDLPKVRLMVCLREPVERAFSAYLFMLNQGRVRGAFDEEILRTPELITHGMYAKHLLPYIETFGLDRIHIGVFDELKIEPKVFASKLFNFLGIREIELPEEVLKKVLPASKARFMPLAKYAKKTALIIRELGFPNLVTRIKQSAVIRKALYRPYEPHEMPVLSEKAAKALRNVFRGEIKRLDELLEMDFRRRWGYLEDDPYS